jgi:lipoate---protein ligase
MLRSIQRPETDPYYNLAAEEYLLKTATTDTFMTWRNEPSVIIGKHQNALKEINYKFIEEHNLPVIRRISGGGTVYHDPGNLNFSFVFTERKENLIDFVEFTRPIILFLHSLGLNASYTGKNNISIDGLKVSGNSAHLYKSKVLYHGTLLFNTDLEILEKATSGRNELFNDKAVNSVRAKVSNIIDLLEDEISIHQFTRLFNEFIMHNFHDYFEDKLNDEEVKTIRQLAKKKYRSFEWNYGYSPDYEFNERWVYNEDEYSARLHVKGGIIQQVDITGPATASELLDQFSKLIKNNIHDRKRLIEISRPLFSGKKNDTEILNQIADHLF